MSSALYRCGPRLLLIGFCGGFLRTLFRLRLASLIMAVIFTFTACGGHSSGLPPAAAPQQQPTASSAIASGQPVGPFQIAQRDGNTVALVDAHNKALVILASTGNGVLNATSDFHTGVTSVSIPADIKVGETHSIGTGWTLTRVSPEKIEWTGDKGNTGSITLGQDYTSMTIDSALLSQTAGYKPMTVQIRSAQSREGRSQSAAMCIGNGAGAYLAVTAFLVAMMISVIVQTGYTLQNEMLALIANITIVLFAMVSVAGNQCGASPPTATTLPPTLLPINNLPQPTTPPSPLVCPTSKNISMVWKNNPNDSNAVKAITTESSVFSDPFGVYKGRFSLQVQGDIPMRFQLGEGAATHVNFSISCATNASDSSSITFTLAPNLNDPNNQDDKGKFGHFYEFYGIIPFLKVWKTAEAEPQQINCSPDFLIPNPSNCNAIQMETNSSIGSDFDFTSPPNDTIQTAKNYPQSDCLKIPFTRRALFDLLNWQKSLTGCCSVCYCKP